MSSVLGFYIFLALALIALEPRFSGTVRYWATVAMMFVLIFALASCEQQKPSPPPISYTPVDRPGALDSRSTRPDSGNMTRGGGTWNSGSSARDPGAAGGGLPSTGSARPATLVPGGASGTSDFGAGGAMSGLDGFAGAPIGGPAASVRNSGIGNVTPQTGPRRIVTDVSAVEQMPLNPAHMGSRSPVDIQDLIPSLTPIRE